MTLSVCISIIRGEEVRVGLEYRYILVSGNDWGIDEIQIVFLLTMLHKHVLNESQVHGELI